MSAAGDAAIDILADAVGIEPGYRDVDGRLRQISPAAKRALLLSMGHALDSEDAVHAAVRARRESRYHRLLAPAVVLWREPGTNLSCPMTFPEERVERSLDWSLQPEQGAALAGSLSLASLEPSERCSVNGVWFVRACLPLPKHLENGYHRLTVVTGGLEATATLVAGEDLGTLPEGFRERMADANIMSYRLMMFERYASGLFRRPATYPRVAVATFGTHDLPSLRRWWHGQDLEFRRTRGLSAAAEAEQEVQHRHTDRELLIAALHDQQLINDDTLDDFDALVVAVERFLARTPSALMMANPTDMLGEAVQINVPGTVSEHPNWRHRFRLPVDALQADPLIRRIAAAIVAERGPGSSESLPRRQQPD